MFSGRGGLEQGYVAMINGTGPQLLQWLMRDANTQRHLAGCQHVAACLARPGVRQWQP
jgi:hypothetical protein